MKMYAPETKGATAPKASPNPAPSAPAATAPASAAPSSPDKKAAKRVKYAVPEAGLDSWPADFDGKKHKPLMRGDFKDEGVFLKHRIDDHKSAIVKLETEVADLAKYGPGGANKAKKLAKVTDEYETLMAALKAQGMDVDAMLAAHRAKAANKAS